MLLMLTPSDSDCLQHNFLATVLELLHKTIFPEMCYFSSSFFCVVFQSTFLPKKKKDKINLINIYHFHSRLSSSSFQFHSGCAHIPLIIRPAVPLPPVLVSPLPLFPPQLIQPPVPVVQPHTTDPAVPDH